jgi:hypothetical protein
MQIKYKTGQRIREVEIVLVRGEAHWLKNLGLFVLKGFTHGSSDPFVILLAQATSS